jgi:hypothetical protein
VQIYLTVIKPAHGRSGLTCRKEAKDDHVNAGNADEGGDARKEEQESNDESDEGQQHDASTGLKNLRQE